MEWNGIGVGASASAAVYQRIETQTRDEHIQYTEYIVVDFVMNLIGCHLLNVKLHTLPNCSVASTQFKWDTHNHRRVFNRFEMNEQSTHQRMRKRNETKTKLKLTIILSFECKVTNAAYTYTLHKTYCFGG